jgi:hypothetical protein
MKMPFFDKFPHTSTITHPSKRKIKAKKQIRDNNGKFSKQPRLSGECDEWSDKCDEWDDENDSEWNDEISLSSEKITFKDKPFELTWSDNTHLEKKKRGPYLTGKTKKSTHFDKYGPSDSFIKAAKETIKITTFMNNNKLIPDDFKDVLDDMDEEEQNQLDISERIENLRTELKEQQKILTAAEYNKKRAIYKYLKRLGENEKGKMKVSKEVAQLIFIDCVLYRARSIQYWTNFWLRYNHLPISCQGKHQKIIRLIDDEDIVEECHIWIRSQGEITTPLKFKEFVEQKLLVNSGITKKKTISIKTAARWLNILGYTFQSQKQGKKLVNAILYKKITLLFK